VGIVRDRDRRSLVVPAVLVAALVVQFAVGTSQQPLGHATVALTDLPSIYALRVAGSLLVGDVFLDNFWLSLGHAFLYGAILAVLAVGALGVTRGRRSSRVFVAGTLALSFLTMAAPLIIRGTCCFLDRAAFNLNGSRYFVVPVLLLAAAVLKVLDEGLSAPAPAPRRRARWQAAQLAVTLAGAGLLLVNYSVVNVRNAGPFWANSVREAQAVCSGARGTPPAVAALGVAPPLNPAPFAVKVPCGRLR
jgi:hypothetical protein